MLADADADLVRRDGALPGLATLLDADEFVAVLRANVPRLNLTSVRSIYVRYKPGTSCLVSYEVRVAGVQVGVHATAYTMDRLPLLHSPKRPSVQGSLGAGRIVVDQEVLEIRVFPNDGVLRVLRRLWETTARDRLIRKRCPGRPELWRSCVELLAYKPGRRCVGLLTGRKARRAIVKAYAAAGYERALVGANAFVSCDLLGVARPLGHSRRSGFIVFDWLPGDRLEDLIRQTRADTACVQRVGAALALLHGQRGAGLRASRPDDQREMLAGVARGVGFLCPPLADRAARLARDVEARVKELAAEDQPIHGDFYAGQVLIASEMVNVIDLDRACRGDPRTDIANFIAHLECGVLDGALSATGAATLADALMDGYEEAARRPCRNGIDAHVAAALLALAPRPFRTRDPNWADRTMAILDRAESMLAFSRPTRRTRRLAVPSASDPFDTLNDRALSLSPEAFDAAAMGRRLSRLPPSARGRRAVAVRAIRVCRHKPARRCLIEYDVEVVWESGSSETTTVVAKVRAKGADTRTYRIVEALWRRGFSDESADGISVPEPLGVLPELKMWLQWKAPGVSAAFALNDGGGDVMSERAAAAIYKLHQSGVASCRHHGIEDELRILQERLTAVATEAPRWGPRLEAIYDACVRLAGALPAIETRGIHRDFHPGQLLVNPHVPVSHNGPGDSGRVYLLDLDLYAAGDPALDVGNFLGHITEHSLRAFADPDRLTGWEAALKARFLASDSKTSARAVEIYKTLTLARHIHISTRFPERRSSTERLVELCEARLGLV